MRVSFQVDAFRKRSSMSCAFLFLTFCIWHSVPDISSQAFTGLVFDATDPQSRLDLLDKKICIS